MDCKKRQKFRAAFNKKFPQAVKPVKVKDSAILWSMLALARLYLATVQTGYIHPDEFHQSVQVMARDILDIDARKPWEFQSENPIRSVTFSVLVSLPYLLLKYLAPVTSYLFEYDLLTPNTLLVAPRLFMTLLSFIAAIACIR
ncbi:GPI mannosyltransferase 4 [Chionoecetes opilio]|uniref:GPI mannosyltransferase 4 n=1 Tax=Chionoecetes opilio TaxID=41210 RepID=A0A8J8WNL9_CHIOP|nr:GPI mannosyltransferase 4 [Chionoecetes opilio]